MNQASPRCSLAIALLLAACGSSGGGNEPVIVAWDFPEGDCASNEVVTVRIAYLPDGGDVSDPFEFDCTDGSGSIGVLGEGSYGIIAEGIDDEDIVVAQNFGNTINLGPEGFFGEVDVTLHPKPADVVVTWEEQGGQPCPFGFVIPYFISLYTPPEGGDDVGTLVTTTQRSCSDGEATLTNVAPGDYVVEADTRAISPDRRGVAPVTVMPGIDATVHVVLD